ncbi:unnamed protein product, partial [Scytosiphon promiscuus]
RRLGRGGRDDAPGRPSAPLPAEPSPSRRRDAVAAVRLRKRKRRLLGQRPLSPGYGEKSRRASSTRLPRQTGRVSSLW